MPKPKAPPFAGTNPATSLKQVILALPWYKSVEPLSAFSVMGLLGPQVGLMMAHSDAFISNARNRLADTFLQTPAEWCLMLDDDMVFPFGNGDWFDVFFGRRLPEPFRSFHTIERLLSHKKTLVGGLYWQRAPNGHPVFAGGAEWADRLRESPQDTILPVQWVGTGCLLIHRSVFEDIERRYPHLGRTNGRGGRWFSPSEQDLRKYTEEAFRLLNGPVNEQNWQEVVGKTRPLLQNALGKGTATGGPGLGEDVQFCFRAALAGHQPYVDLGLVCGHVGGRVFNGR